MPMWKLLIITTAYAIALALMFRAAKRIQEGHALAGRLGPSEQNRVLAARARTALQAAESHLCTEAFVGGIEPPTTVAIRRLDGRWHEWTLADGPGWKVRHRATRVSGAIVEIVEVDRTAGTVDVRMRWSG